MPVVHSTFTIERHYRHARATVFAAFADAATKRRWFADDRSNDVEAFESDFRPGGTEMLRYRLGAQTPFPGAEIASTELFEAIIPDERIVTTSRMTFGGQAISVLLVTIELADADGGTLLLCTVQGAFFEDADGPQMREHGWRVLLDRLGEVLG